LFIEHIGRVRFAPDIYPGAAFESAIQEGLAFPAYIERRPHASRLASRGSSGARSEAGSTIPRMYIACKGKQILFTSEDVGNFNLLSGSTPSSKQVKNERNQRDDQKQVNQSRGNVENQETTRPQEQKDQEEC
jgi:hypothetical protein